MPVAITTLQQYAGGAIVAASLSGLVNGYNGNYSGGVFGADPTLGLCEKAGLAVGTALSFNPWKMGKTAVAKIAHSEITNVAIGKMMQKGSKCVSYFSKNTAIQSTKKVATSTTTVATNILEKSTKGTAQASIKAIEAGEHVFTNTAFQHLPKRPFMKSPITITNIIKSGEGVGFVDKTFMGGINYKVLGSFNGSKGIYELGIDPSTATIYHFLFRKVKFSTYTQ